MKDVKYFDGKTYIFVNEELKTKLIEHAKKEKMSFYFVVDVAMREYAQKRKIQFGKQPLRPMLG